MRITGRVKDVINRGGEKVPVAEIEQLLHAHPAVRDVAIVAMPDERLGERACAFVVLDDGAELDFEAMLEYLDSATGRQDVLARATRAGRVAPADAVGQDPEVRAARAHAGAQLAEALSRACRRRRPDERSRAPVSGGSAQSGALP